MTSVNTVPARLALIGSAINGIVSSADPPPVVILPAQLPCLYVVTGRAVHSEDDADFGLESRIYMVRVACVGIGQATPSYRETRGRPLIDAVVEAYDSRPTLTGLAWVQKARPIGDSGIVVLPDFDAQWVGFEVQVNVTFIRKRTYATSE